MFTNTDTRRVLKSNKQRSMFRPKLDCFQNTFCFQYDVRAPFTTVSYTSGCDHVFFMFPCPNYISDMCLINIIIDMQNTGVKFA